MTALKVLGDNHLFRAHDLANLGVFVLVAALPFMESSLRAHDYQLGKLTHLLGLLWFFGGLILSAFCLSRLVWSQPALDHDKLSYGYRAILLLELFCIPSIALMAWGGMVMASHLGGYKTHAWAFQGYVFLLGTPPILMAIPRFYHKRLIKGAGLDIERERRLALWQDWTFITIMSILFAALSASMIFKSPIF